MLKGGTLRRWQGAHKEMKTMCLFLPLYQCTAIFEVGDSKKSLNFIQKWSQYLFYNFIWRTYLASRCTPWLHWPIYFISKICLHCNSNWFSCMVIIVNYSPISRFWPLPCQPHPTSPSPEDEHATLHYILIFFKDSSHEKMQQ